MTLRIIESSGSPYAPAGGPVRAIPVTWSSSTRSIWNRCSGKSLKAEMITTSPGCNWLTAIRGDLLALCGGRDQVLRRLDRPGFQTAGYGAGGLLVQAGPSPRIGNLSKGAALPHYGDLARALRPARLHVDGGRMPHLAYYGPENVLYSDELMAKVQSRWLARFDAYGLRAAGAGRSAPCHAPP